jgi:hypothetical protein
MPFKVDWANSSRAKQLLEHYFFIFENNCERQRLDASRLGFAHYYFRPKSAEEKSSSKQKDRELWPWKKQSLENRSSSNKGSSIKSLSDFSN